MPSLLSEKDNMMDFPRGGGSGLTNLEIKEIKHEVEAELEASAKKPKKKRSSSESKISKKQKTEDDIYVHVELLAFKKLYVGMSLVGAIKEINELDLVVSLPNQLTGFVSITEVSDFITQKVSMVAEADEDADEDLPDLNNYFSIGMPVIVAITKLEEPNQKDLSKRRIELSMRPEIINAQLAAQDVANGMTICATIKSEEDHGYLLSLGIEGLSGFMNKDANREYKIGSWIFVTVKECNEPKNVARCEIPTNYMKCLLSNSHSMEIESFKAGMAVQATVKSVSENGLIMSFMGYFIGTVDFLHLGDLELDSIEIGKKFVARIIYTDTIKKKFGLSLNPFLVSWKESRLLSVPDLEIGTIVDHVKVKSIERHGLLLDIKDLGKGFVHTSNLSDLKAEKTDKRYKVGSIHKARVIAIDYVDDLVLVTFQNSVIEQPIMTHQDIKVGSIIKGKILKVDSYGVIVGITNSIKGLCPTQHLSDAKISDPEKLFKVNSSTKFQILSVDTKSKKVMLTHRKSFMSSRFPWITSYENVEPGSFSIGLITSVHNFGCIVHFYDNVNALVPLSELSDEYIKDPSELFSVGQVMKCRIISVDASKKKMRASFKLQSKVPTSIASLEKMENVVLGTVTIGTVNAVLPDGLIVHIPEYDMEGFISKMQITDNLNHTEKLLALFKEGDKLSEVLILSKDMRRGVLQLSMKPWLIYSAKSGYMKEVKDLKAGMILPGFVKNVTETACFISFGRDLVGMSTLHNLSDIFINNAKDSFINGQSVIAHISKIDYDENKIFVSLKESVLLSSTNLKKFEEIRLNTFIAERTKLRKSSIKAKDLSDCESWSSHFTISGYANGTVKSIMPYGTILDMKLGGSGLITHFSKASYKQGDSLMGQILDIDISKKIVDLRLCDSIKNMEEIPNLDEKSISKIAKIIASGETVDASVLVIKEDIAIISISACKNVIGYCLSKGLNTKSSNFKRFKVGQQFKGLILSFDSGVLLVAPTQGKNLSDNVLDLRRTVKQSLDPEISSIDDYKLGKLTVGRIQSIKQTQMNITLGANMKGRVHISEVVDTAASNSANIFKNFKVGELIKVKVIGFNDAKSHKFLPFSHRKPVSQTVVELTIRPSELELMDCTLVDEFDERRPTLSSIRMNTEYTGYVHQLEDKYIWIHVGPKLLGRVSIFNLSLDPEVITNRNEHFKVGSVVKCFLLSKDETKNLLDLTLIPEASVKSKDDLKLDQILMGRITKINNGLSIQVAPNIFAKAHITDLADKFSDNILENFSPDDFVKCRVVGMNDDKSQIDVSLRGSLLGDGSVNIQDPEITSFKNVKENSVMRGYVKNISANGLYVSIGRNVVGRVKIKDLCDSFVKDWKNLFKVGQLVRGKVLSVNEENGWIDLTLKASVVDPSSSPALKFDVLSEGMKVDGFIKAIQSYGVFIQLNGSELSGLCHISELSDAPVSQIDKLYEVGDPVKAIILKVDGEKRKLSLGLKASYFDEMDVDEPEEIEEKDDESMASSDSEEDASDDASEDGSDDASEEDTVMHLENSHNDLASDASSDDGLSEEEPLPLNGFKWNHTIESNVSESEPEEAIEQTAKKSKRAKKRAKKEEEEAIARKELSLLHEESPQVADDFERLLVANPNSSYMWIKYMAFYIQMIEIENARKVAERALSTINFRDEQEKLNIWVAYLNLENSFGDPESLSKVFERAISYNDPKKVYIHLATIYDKTDKNDECDQLYKVMIKKFKTSSQVWINYAHFLSKQNLFDQIHSVLTLSLKSLPKDKHVSTILSFALLEFKKGNPERGRTLFEGLLSNYPKRVDIWSVYLDQETRIGDLAIVRRLFERAIRLDRSTKKMKFLFKKYLQFENEYGTEDTQNHVKEEAIKYVERVSKA